MSGLRVETEDFAVAARAVHDRVGEAVAAALARLRQALLQSAGMAGDDPAGQQWARDYDVAAATAMRAAVAGANSVYRLGEMFVQSAHNYEAAEAASTTGAGPPGWSLVMHLVHAAWPNGHQDRLHAAADAWMTCDTALDDGADQLVRAPDVLERDRLPEGEDVRIMCAALAGRPRELAQAHRTLAHACLGRFDRSIESGSWRVRASPQTISGSIRSDHPSGGSCDAIPEQTGTRCETRSPRGKGMMEP